MHMAKAGGIFPDPSLFIVFPSSQLTLKDNQEQSRIIEESSHKWETFLESFTNYAIVIIIIFTVVFILS